MREPSVRTEPRERGPSVTARTNTQFVPWDGGCVFVGRFGGIVPLHAHHAIQVAFGDTPGIGFRTSERAEWARYAGAIIPSRQPHSMDVSSLDGNAVIFVEPETREGRRLAERYLGMGIAPLDAELLATITPPLFAACFEERDAASVERAALRVVHALTGGVEPAVVVDARILRAISYIKAHIAEPLTLEAVAEVACLSPSRFRHLFVQETGTALRPYILWRRFMRAWELLREGASHSAAAHAAGFADAAHFSRTSRRMFGFPPTTMTMVASQAGRDANDGG